MALFSTLSRFTALGMAAALALGGCSQAAQLPAGASVAELQATTERARNAQLASNMRTLQMAIEQYAVDHGGRYPTTEALLDTLTEKDAAGHLYYYLPGNRLPDNPWAPGEPHQANSLDTAGARPALTPPGQAATPIGTLLGLGHAVAGGAYDVRTFGSLLYEFDAKSQTYTLYAIGKQGDQAVVVGSTTTGPY